MNKKVFKNFIRSIGYKYSIEYTEVLTKNSKNVAYIFTFELDYLIPKRPAPSPPYKPKNRI